VHLPTLGTVVLPGPAGDTATISVDGEGFTVRAGGSAVIVRSGGGPADGWLPARRFVGDSLTVLLEDGDPYRDCHSWQTADRVSAAAADSWLTTIAAAWRLILDEVPAQAPGLRHGLRAVVPLQPDPAGLMRASTARNAFGAVAAAAAPADALAVMLVHEFQHGKLGALLDLCDLLDPDDRQRLRVGWRADPRPIEGVLQGTYAHLAVTDIWRVRAARSSSGQAAVATFRQYHAWTADAIDALGRCGALTPAGLRFVDRMAGSLAGWSDEEPPS
jgi:uncharacterized protein